MENFDFTNISQSNETYLLASRNFLSTYENAP